MSTYTINGKIFAEMLSLGAARLAEQAGELNRLNVFPVADGDTGTNMFSTISGGLSAIEDDLPDSIGELSGHFARAVLLSARGNSGVILSQIFAGINEYLKDCDSASAAQLADAYKNGIKTSYAAVQNPTEGTILTVFRESTEYAIANIDEDSSVEDFFRLHVEAARRSLENTPTLLPALAEAEVVDSGGAGYLCIAEGMYGALVGEEMPKMQSVGVKKAEKIDIDRFTRDSVLEFGYCTEFLLRLTSAKVDPDSFDINIILDELNSLHGESIVAYKTDDIVKVHVHTFNPGEILTMAQRYGEFLTLKIENMSLGHSEEKSSEAKKKKKYAVVTVATGDGLSALFKDMGADVIIEGGQTANPSTGQFVDAFKACNAETIVVLPNTKNIFLSASCAAELYTEANVRVVKTSNLMQGYSALSVINPGIDSVDDIVSSAEAAANSVIDGEITRAIRSVTVDGRSITEGEYIAISGGSIVANEGTAEEAIFSLLSECDVDLCEVLTLFVGQDVDEDSRASITERLEEEYPDLEITVYNGGQQVYDYLIAVE